MQVWLLAAIVTGAGDRAFSAGLDVKAVAAGDLEAGDQRHPVAAVGGRPALGDRGGRGDGRSRGGSPSGGGNYSRRKQGVTLDGTIPTFRFATPDAALDKTVWMAHGQHTTYISYFLRPGSRPATLRLMPLVTYRDHHHETIGTPHWHFAIQGLPGGCEIVAFPGAVPYRMLTVPAAEFIPTGIWYWRFLHRREYERGLDFLEDLYYPGLFTLPLRPGERLTLIATIEPPETVERDAAASLARAQERQRRLLRLADAVAGAAPPDAALAVPVQEAATEDEACRRQLVLAADQFLVRRSDGAGEPGSVTQPDGAGEPNSIVAGYHWFADWGRDTMIALPGLTLATGRAPVAAAILRQYARYLDEGMLPNHFPDSGAAPAYNTVDAVLRYCQALHQYLQHTADDALLAELFPSLAEVVDWHCRGTRYGIAVDPTDGLLRAGAPGVALTWMDAKVDDWVVTPRRGKPVEVNALWYNATALMAEWAGRLGRPAAPYRALAAAAHAGFAARFWYPAGGYLYDVVDGEQGDDPSLRPNQIFAVSLPCGLLAPAQERAIVDVVAARLLTPRGLRTLDPADARYQRHYEGDRRRRDAAYHRGAVWSWLIGPFVQAHLKVYGDRAAARAMLRPWREHLLEGGVGTIGEVYDAEPPYAPRGCIAQAWGVAEVLRAWVGTRIAGER